MTTALAFGSSLFTGTPAICSLGLVRGGGIAVAWAGFAFVFLSPLLAQRETRRLSTMPMGR